MAYPRIASFKSHAHFVDYVTSLELDLPCDEAVLSGDESPLSQPILLDDITIGNRFCILADGRLGRND